MLGAFAGAGCEEHEFHPPDRAEQVAAAESAYAEVRFDTITWSDPEDRLDAGNLVYADECRRCHGAFGRGATPYARERGLEAPALVGPDLAAGDEVEAIRRRIYVGHAADMPSWGLGRLTPRQIDAAAYYVLRLREEAPSR